MRRGEVWWADLPDPWGRRPVVLLARDEAYTLLSWMVVAPLTRRIRRLPTIVVLDPADDGVPELSAVNVDNLQAVERAWLQTYVVRLSSERMREIDRAIHFALGLRNCPDR